MPPVRWTSRRNAETGVHLHFFQQVRCSFILFDLLAYACAVHPMYSIAINA
jgi:hypothetical protein